MAVPLVLPLLHQQSSYQDACNCLSILVGRYDQVMAVVQKPGFARTPWARRGFPLCRAGASCVPLGPTIELAHDAYNSESLSASNANLQPRGADGVLRARPLRTL